jgi:hypothetical protein
MPKGPKGQKRPADVVANAIMVAKIATGEIEDPIEDDGKDKAAQSLGRRGGKARAEKISAEQRAEIAKKAARARWGKDIKSNS